MEGVEVHGSPSTTHKMGHHATMARTNMVPQVSSLLSRSVSEASQETHTNSVSWRTLEQRKFDDALEAARQRMVVMVGAVYELDDLPLNIDNILNQVRGLQRAGRTLILNTAPTVHHVPLLVYMASCTCDEDFRPRTLT